jgi:D-aminopeptidase
MPVVEFDARRIDAIFAPLDQCLEPGAAVGIAIGGEPVYRKGFGSANLELPVQLSPTMRMRIGSTTKHFASLAYMLLCEQGRARLDDPVGKYLPELHPVTHGVTLRQLMGHVGGLRDAFDISFLFNGTGQLITSAELLEMYRSIDDVNAPPGRAWDYNNGGYLMLSAAIERITGQPLEVVLRERIFEPVGMHDTLLRRFDNTFVPNSASPHMTTLANFVANSAGPCPARSPPLEFEKATFGTDFAGAGAMVSTIDDMLRWLAHMDSPVVGTRETWSTMKSPQTLANGASTGYGLGLMLGRYRGVDTLHHAGGWLGGNAQMLKVPSAGLDVMTIVNRHDVSALLLVNSILDACLPDLEPIESAPNGALAVGTFRSPTSGRVIELFGSPGRQTVSIDGCDWPFVPGRDGVLRPVPAWSFLKQAVSLIGDRAQPEAIHLDDFGSRDELIRSVPPEGIGGTSIVGRYRSETTGVEATIATGERGLRLVALGRHGSAVYRLKCLAENVWRADEIRGARAAVLSFDADGSALRLTSYHTWSLILRRVA